MSRNKGMIRLRAPQGTDEANIGTERFRVDDAGTIEVPQDTASTLTGTAGFTEVTSPVAVPDGHARVIHDDNEASCSAGGLVFDKQADGSYHVPVALVTELISHGFIAVDSAN